MTKNKDAIEPAGGGVASRTAIYNKIASKQEKILQTLFDLLDSKQEAVRMGAAKTLINKIVPDLKAEDITSQGQKIQVVFHDSLKKNE